MGNIDWYRKHLTQQQPQPPPQQAVYPPSAPPPLVQPGPVPQVQMQPAPQEMPASQTVQHWDGQVGSETRLRQAIQANAAGIGEAHRDSHVHVCDMCGHDTFLTGLPRDLTGVPPGAVVRNSSGQRVEPLGRCTNCGYNGQFRQGRPENYTNQ